MFFLQVTFGAFGPNQFWKSIYSHYLLETLTLILTKSYPMILKLKKKNILIY